MTHRRTLEKILASGSIAIVRATIACDLMGIVEALGEGGLEVVEITATTPGACEAIHRVSTGLPDVLIGAGTVIDAASARRVLDAGARFLVSPTMDEEVMQVACERQAVAIPGALTPTEIVAARNAGADVVKVFPAATYGPDYIQALKAPLPGIRLAPTGGVTGANAGAYLQAGAAVVCVGSWLVPRDAVRRGKYAVISERARALVNTVARFQERVNE